jgi:hypothetical protein
MFGHWNWAEKLIYGACAIAALEFIYIVIDNSLDLYEWRVTRKGFFR